MAPLTILPGVPVTDREAIELHRFCWIFGLRFITCRSLLHVYIGVDLRGEGEMRACRTPLHVVHVSGKRRALSRFTAIEANRPDLPGAGAIGNESDGVVVSAPSGRDVTDIFGRGELTQSRAVGAHEPQVRRRLVRFGIP